MLTSASLKGGHLVEVARERLLQSEALRAKFDSKLGKADAKIIERWKAAFGWKPAAEFVEWAAVLPAYNALFREIADTWMLGGGIEWLSGKPRVEPMLSDLDETLRLLTGLELFGHDPSGDRCFASTLPSRTGTVDVHVYNHENGELDGSLYYSIADLIFTCFYDYDSEEEPGGTKLMAAFNRDMKKARRGLAPHEEPRALFKRVKWLWGLPSGSPGYHFAEELGYAPAFAQFEKEKRLFDKAPWLANYWLLAHWFLGNDQACAETVTLAAKVPGSVTPELAKLVGGLLAKPEKAKLGKLGAKKLAELRAMVRKNVDPSLLEPAARAETEKDRSQGVRKADRKTVLARLAAKEDGWKLMAEFPDDVATHDLILDALAKKDRTLAESLERYRSTRAGEVGLSEWPNSYEKTKVDRRFSVPVAAAFRAGLAFDSDNSRAASALVSTLAHFDDDLAMEAFSEAIAKLEMNDERLKYIVEGLQRSKHRRARSLLDAAAWRFFDFLERTIAAKKKTDAEGATLDNMFRVHSYLLPAVISSIVVGDEASEKLVDKVLSITSNMSVLETAYAAAYRQVGLKKLTRHERITDAFCRTVEGFDGEALPEVVHFNFAEATLAYAKLAPKRAGPMLRKLIAKKREPKLQLDVMGGALAGLLVLFPKDKTLLGWADRILANRSNDSRVYGVLRGIAEAKIKAAKDWVRPHAYDAQGISDDETLGLAARAALVALGEPRPPDFDDEDEFATDVPKGKLVAALEQPHRYRRDYVFERMVEEEAVGKDFREAALRALRDELRFTSDPCDSSRGELAKNALRLLMKQGADSLPGLASLFDVEGIAPGERTVILYCMGLTTDVPALLERLAAMDEKKLLGLLRSPTPDVMGALDVVAGVAHARFGEKAQGAIEAALEWRWTLSGADDQTWFDHEPTATRLAVLAVRSKHGAAFAKRLRSKEDDESSAVLRRAMELQPPIVGFAGSERVLTMAIRPSDYDGPRYECMVSHDGKRLSVTWRGERIYFEGMLSGERYEQTRTFTAPSTTADLICRALTAIGFAEPAPAKKAKKKR